MIAIINTVDSKFVKRGVYLFETRTDAKLWAVKTIRKHFPTTFSGIKDSDVLLEFQGTLGPTEFFHIEQVHGKLQS
jgi:hypothetical protein